jgi:hypothetical protein
MNLITPPTIIFFKKIYRVAAEEIRGSSRSSLVIKISDSGTMVIQSAHHSGRTGMKRFPFLICLAFLLLIVQVGFTSADSPTTTTTTPGMTGGSIYFETNPPGATIWLDNIELGASPFTYYSEKTGTLDVRVRKRLYEDYTDKVVVVEGKRVVFYARLIPVPSYIPEQTTPVIPVTTTTTISTSAITIPTPWPTSSPQSPVDPAVVIGAAAIGIGFFAIRRR